MNEMNEMNEKKMNEIHEMKNKYKINWKKKLSKIYFVPREAFH